MMICAGASEQGCKPVGFDTCRKRPWHHKDGRRPCRPDGVCGFDGSVAGILWKIRGQDLAGLFYGAEQSAVYCFLPGYFSAWVPQLSLVCCALCGLSVGIMWPGTFSKAAAALPKGGTAMFALLALGGDVGCSGGPTLVGFVSEFFGGDLKKGILAGGVFPVLLLLGVALCRQGKEE